MKEPVNYLLLLISAILFQVSQYKAIPENREEVKIEITEESHYEASFQFTTNHVGLINTAENRLAHNSSPVCETEETERKHQKQKTFEALSAFQYITAKVYIQNECISSKRQPYFHSIITENRQLRL